MALVDKIKRDFKRHKQKAMVLGVLAVVMIGFVAKAYFDMAPKTAAAGPTPTGAPSPDASAARAQDPQHDPEQTRLLWKTLRDKRGLPNDFAFTFIYQHFNRDPSRKQPAAPDKAELADPNPKIIVNTEEMRLAELKAKVLAASRNLVVRSTVVSSARPVAVINDQSIPGSDRILGVGDRINGFKITSIRAREVEFEKDGITLVVDMARNTGNK